MKAIVLKPFSLLLIGIVTVMVCLVLTIAQPAAAQCGSSASSCKSCHETQGQDPVNTKGDWHTQHAFGDFCEFCHAGNVQAKEKDAAHQGLVDPLSDVNASCQSCHPQDAVKRGQKYAAVLGVTLNNGSSGGSSDSNTSDGSSAAPKSSVAAPLGGEEINYNLLYAEKTAPQALISNWANVILLVMIAGLAVAFFITAWTWEGWAAKVANWIRQNVKPVSEAVVEANASVTESTGAAPTAPELKALDERRPELRGLWSKLANSDPTLLKDLDQVLSDEEQGPKLLHAISHLDLKRQSTEQ